MCTCMDAVALAHRDEVEGHRASQQANMQGRLEGSIQDIVASHETSREEEKVQEKVRNAIERISERRGGTHNYIMRTLEEPPNICACIIIIM